MAIADGQLVTVFQFVCAKCRHLTELRESHSGLLRPRLFSSKCARCDSLNWLGGVSGAIQDSVMAPVAERAPVPGRALSSPS